MRSALLILLMSTSTIGLTNCHKAETITSVTCSETDISIDCLLLSAQNTLDKAEDAFIFASGSAELAVAYDVSGRHEEAANLISEAIERASAIEDIKKKGSAFGEIMTAIASLSNTNHANKWAASILAKSTDLEERTVADISAKAVVTRGVHGDVKAAYQEAMNLPQTSQIEGYAKAIALRKFASLLAKKGDFESAQDAVNAVTMSIDYYKALVRTDVARIAHDKGNNEVAENLLNEAIPIARSLENGYFSGAALRDVAFSYHGMGQEDKAQSFFTEALEATGNADKQNEKARATSRIATRLADAGLKNNTKPVLEKAAAFAKDIESDVMQSYSYYEIAGSAGISGQFDLAKKWLENVPENPMGSTSSIHSAAKRDLAWGLTRYGKTKEALEVVNTIKAPREKIHSLSRMVRVLKDPKMEALPRYL